MAVNGSIRLPEVATPDTPAANTHRLFIGTDNALKKVDDTGSVTTYAAISSNSLIRSCGITIDGGGSAITTGVKGFISIPYTGTISEWTLVADQSGNIVIDVWKVAYASFPPTVLNTIAGSEKPTLSGVANNRDTSLTTWTTAVTAGDVIGFNVDSASTVTRVTLVIKVTVT